LLGFIDLVLWSGLQGSREHTRVRICVRIFYTRTREGKLWISSLAPTRYRV
jgi:hypothetical protein